MRKIRFVFPAIFINEEDAVQVVFPDLNIYTDGKDMSDAYLRAKDLLYVYFSYAVKYDVDFNKPTDINKLLPKCKTNETVMLMDALIEL